MGNQFHPLLVDMTTLSNMSVERIQEARNAAADATHSILLSLSMIGRLSAFAVCGGSYEGEDALEDMKSISATLEPLANILIALHGVKENTTFLLNESNSDRDEVRHT